MVLTRRMQLTTPPSTLQLYWTPSTYKWNGMELISGGFLSTNDQWTEKSDLHILHEWKPIHWNHGTKTALVHFLLKNQTFARHCTRHDASWNVFTTKILCSMVNCTTVMTPTDEPFIFVQGELAECLYPLVMAVLPYARVAWVRTPSEAELLSRTEPWKLFLCWEE